VSPVGVDLRVVVNYQTGWRVRRLERPPEEVNGIGPTALDNRAQRRHGTLAGVAFALQRKHRSSVRAVYAKSLPRALRAASGSALAMLGQNGQRASIMRLFTACIPDISNPSTIRKFAQEAGMSVSAFHTSNFKQVTETSPLQYVKAVRLHKARTLIMDADWRRGGGAQGRL